ncbi:MAG: translational GTPase TypA [Candidatus Taylorbacteria bacterium]|nr:translational GTPase TypA [Candidatus Taylorbacteria bacterium]
MKEKISNLRNIAIIAHVDHGKTTLVDFLLKQSNTFHAKAEELGKDLIMDSNDLERERGITILAKNTAVNYDGVKINIIDTPGHADFGGEVERTLNMADGALLLVDAQEGPMPQTKFVLKKAIELNLKIIVVINKIDKPGADIQRTIDEVEDLFLNLSQAAESRGLSAHHLDFPTVYAVGRQGKAWDHVPAVEEMNQPADLASLFKKVIEYIPAPEVDTEAPFQLLVTNLDRDNYQGKYTIGRIARGKIERGQAVAVIDREGKSRQARVDKIFVYQGLHRTEVDRATAGEIVSLTGITDAGIGSTIADAQSPEALPLISIEEPTLRVRIGPNTSPFKGKEGSFVTSRQIAERLYREVETNVGMRLEELGGTDFLVSGRGELHLSILIETLRREGFELEISKPEVIIKEVEGKKMEPFEEVTIDIPEEHLGIVTTEFGKRKASMVNLTNHQNGYSRMVYHISTRGFLGLRNVLVTETKGTAVTNSVLLGYQEQGDILPRSRNGVLIASETGKAVAFGLQTAQGRGTVFVAPTTEVYEGMIVGLNSRKEDLEINVCKGKELTNMRSKGADEAIVLTPPLTFTLEQALDFLEDDELLEVTPQNIRLRKKYLTKNDRAKAKR